jgi:Rieske Fe-S protein
MSDEVERLNRVLDDLAAERDPVDRATLSQSEIRLAETAAFLKSAAPGSSEEPDPRFVEQLAARLATLDARQPRHTPAAMAATAAEVSPDGGDTSRHTRGISRRGLLGRIAIAATGAAAGVGAGEVVRGHVDTAAASAAYERGRQEGYLQATSAPFSQPMAPHDRGSWFATGITVASLAPGQATRFRAGAVEGFLVHAGAGKPIYALSAACTHMGCMLSWLSDAGTFLCPCHGAQYQADGTVLSGIARHPLPRLEVRVDEQGSVYVWSVAEQPPDTHLIPYEMP